MRIMMKPGLKNPLMRTINLSLYLSFCGLAGTGALLTWRLVPGSRGGRGLSVLGLGRHDWGDIHFWLGVVFIAMTVFHLLLNWQWLKKIASKSYAWRLWLGLGLGVAIIVGIYTLPMQGGSDPAGSHAEAVEEVHDH
ncbi:MAG: hypothetical protein ACI9JZ_000784 [Lentimonas sp.]|jgi:hypothetical protein